MQSPRSSFPIRRSALIRNDESSKCFVRERPRASEIPLTSFPLTLHADRHPVDPSVLRDLASNLDMQLRHCVGGKLLDKHGTADAPRVTWPRGTASVLEGRERSQPYRTSTRSRVDIYTTELTLASERARQSPSRSTQSRARVGSEYEYE